MKFAALILSAFTLVATAPEAPAQTTGTATERVGCTQPAPPDSLRSLPVSPTTFLPDDGGVVVMEMESHLPTGGWVEETLVGGFAGDSYFRWGGPNLFGQPGVGILPFRFQISKKDTYLIRIHCRHDHGDPSEENDCWARLDGGPWRKLFHNTGSGGVGVWTFNARYEDTGNFPEHVLTAGMHTFEISGRSTNFKIDRVHVLPRTTWFAQLSDPESELERHRPVIGKTMRVAIGDPTNVGGFQPGVAMTLWFAGGKPMNYPCGVVTRWGEALLRLTPAPISSGTAIIWNGPGQPAIHSATHRNDPSLVGLTLVTQGVMFQPGKVMVTNALDLFVGDR